MAIPTINVGQYKSASEGIGESLAGFEQQRNALQRKQALMANTQNKALEGLSNIAQDRASTEVIGREGALSNVQQSVNEEYADRARTVQEEYEKQAKMLPKTIRQPDGTYSPSPEIATLDKKRDALLGDLETKYQAITKDPRFNKVYDTEETANRVYQEALKAGVTPDRAAALREQSVMRNKEVGMTDREKLLAQAGYKQADTALAAQADALSKSMGSQTTTVGSGGRGGKDGKGGKTSIDNLGKTMQEAGITPASTFSDDDQKAVYGLAQALEDNPNYKGIDVNKYIKEAVLSGKNITGEWFSGENKVDSLAALSGEVRKRIDTGIAAGTIKPKYGGTSGSSRTSTSTTSPVLDPNRMANLQKAINTRDLNYKEIANTLKGRGTGAEAAKALWGNRDILDMSPAKRVAVTEEIIKKTGKKDRDILTPPQKKEYEVAKKIVKEDEKSISELDMLQKKINNPSTPQKEVDSAQKTALNITRGQAIRERVNSSGFQKMTPKNKERWVSIGKFIADGADILSKSVDNVLTDIAKASDVTKDFLVRELESSLKSPRTLTPDRSTGLDTGGQNLVAPLAK